MRRRPWDPTAAAGGPHATPPLSWDPMADLSELTTMIEAALPGASARIVDQGGGDHLAADVVAPQFAGLTRLEQHKLVYAAVQSRFDDGSIHALALRTRAPEAT
jgi:stress-induced morphogen